MRRWSGLSAFPMLVVSQWAMLSGCALDERNPTALDADAVELAGGGAGGGLNPSNAPGQMGSETGAAGSAVPLGASPTSPADEPPGASTDGDAGVAPDGAVPGLVIVELSASTLTVEVGQPVQLTCRAGGPAEETVEYMWSTSGGGLANDGATATLIAPFERGPVEVTCSVADAAGASASRTIVLEALLPLRGLRGSWEFSGSASDSSGRGHDGAVFGALFTSDRFEQPNRALLFDGQSEVQILDESDFDLASYTSSAWIRVSAAETMRPIISKSALSNGSWGNYSIIVMADTVEYGPGLLQTIYDIENGNYSASTFPGAIPVDEWAHVAMTFDNRNMRQFLDGRLILDILDTGFDATFNDDPLLIGRNSFGGFVGKIDDVRIYDRALSAEEISAIASDR